jgi:hypothetical protein
MQTYQLSSVFVLLAFIKRTNPKLYTLQGASCHACDAHSCRTAPANADPVRSDETSLEERMFTMLPFFDCAHYDSSFF